MRGSVGRQLLRNSSLHQFEGGRVRVLVLYRSGYVCEECILEEGNGTQRTSISWSSRLREEERYHMIDKKDSLGVRES